MLVYDTESSKSGNNARCVTADATPWYVDGPTPDLEYKEGVFPPYLSRGFVMSSYLITTLDPESICFGLMINISKQKKSFWTQCVLVWETRAT